MFGSVLPDADHKNSKIAKYIKIPFAYRNMKHRGFSHSLLGILAFCVLTLIMLNNESMRNGLILGYSIHIFCDMLTSHGVQLFWPKRKYIKFPMTFTTNSKIESVIANLSIAISICYTIYHLT